MIKRKAENCEDRSVVNLWWDSSKSFQGYESVFRFDEELGGDLPSPITTRKRPSFHWCGLVLSGVMFPSSRSWVSTIINIMISGLRELKVNQWARWFQVNQNIIQHISQWAHGHPSLRLEKFTFETSRQSKNWCLPPGTLPGGTQGSTHGRLMPARARSWDPSPRLSFTGKGKKWLCREMINVQDTSRH